MRDQSLLESALARPVNLAAYEKPDAAALAASYAVAIAKNHPFVDGNGRCARALFYWLVLKHGYWLLEYVSMP